MSEITHCEAPYIERFWSRVDASGDCWEWTGGRDRNGYARFHLGFQPRPAELVHRIAYRLLVGPIQPGLQLDHLCRVRHCVNPDHLEPVTATVNVRRSTAPARQLQKTHCPSGHPYDQENTYFQPDGARRCRLCHRIRMRVENVRSRRAARVAA